MKKLALAVAAASMIAGAAQAGSHMPSEVRLGVALGFTGPAESLAADMAAGAEMAMKEVADSGKLLGGAKVTPVRADSTCVDASAAAAAAERLISAEKVDAIVGALCSGATISILQNVAMPNGVLLFSPSATSPALSTLEDNGYFFRASPSDARQGQVIAEMLQEKGYKSIAMTYTNNDYGKGLADSIQSNFEAAGGKVTINTPHEDGKGDYGAEVGALAQAGGDILVVAGYLDQGGKGIIQSSLDAGAFDHFFLPDAMIGDSLTAAIGPDLNGSIGTVPGTDSPGSDSYKEMFTAATGAAPGPYSDYSYDAAAMTLLAMQAAGTKDSKVVKDHVFEIANAPGEKIYPGELAKGLEILANGGQIDYVGATAVELIGGGESAGSYREILVKDQQNTTVRFR
ncbi:Leucine-, isoleucine-, valine-, threonine-, and alanine-binding protein precursor [Marinobacterium sp. xm-g-59]|uniref:ABC transporter substrate-binding protein n=1 Tax=Marinobacterium sp. xm-g-59 TaxID=2497748 RepID=UPI0015686904|nr:ABC transporter substrate-binding protein [Marinobacterium sp. xm-g-59]NRP95791.1 Leucine-, isoleucine-, valine-, threonine-, and alanine-binding protein precursor [Marinobacterium sp. xm-g-59]